MQNRATAEQFNALMQCEPVGQSETAELTFLKPSYQVAEENRIERLQQRRKRQQQKQADNAAVTILCIVSMLVGVALGVGL